MFFEIVIGERRAVVALGRGQPADLAVETMVVVLAGALDHGRLGFREVSEAAAVEDLSLERWPERFDLAVGPWLSIWVRMCRIAGSSSVR
jgi:hypothetical protein